MLNFILSILNKTESKTKTYNIVNWFLFALLVLLTWKYISHDSVEYPDLNNVVGWVFTSDFISIIIWGIVLGIVIRFFSEFWINIICGLRIVMNTYLHGRIYLLRINRKVSLILNMKNDIAVLLKYVKAKVITEADIKYNQEKVNRILVQVLLVILLNIRYQQNIIMYLSIFVALIVLFLFLVNSIMVIEKNISKAIFT